jgi:hypothetical protein
MRLPRWLLVSLITVSAVAMLAVPAWLWVEMPRWTAMAFRDAFEAGDSDRVNELFANAGCTAVGPSQLEMSFRRGPTLFYANPRISLLDRGFEDVICGRQAMSMDYGWAGRDSGIKFQANRNRVTGDWSHSDLLFPGPVNKP